MSATLSLPQIGPDPQDRQAALAAAAALLAGATILVAGLLSGWVGFLKLFTPLLLFGVGGWLYITRPVLYIGYTWGVWLVVPFVRRLIDHAAGAFDPTNPVMVAPLLVTGLALCSPLRYVTVFRGPHARPLHLCALGIGYGYLVGVVRVGVFSATFALLDWLLPLAFGAHIFLLWKSYPLQRRTLLTTFTWGVLLLGIYGVVQYFTAPSWDMEWLVRSGMTSSMGQPVPTGFRVFSTLNSTGTLAFFLAAGALVLVGHRTLLARAALVPGLLALMLTLVRAAWVGWLAGILLLAIQLRGRGRAEIVLVLLVGLAVAVPAATLSGGAVQTRVETMRQIEQDNSYLARLSFAQIAAGRVLRNPIGNGLGGTGTAAKLSGGLVVVFDNGFLDLPNTLGWLGGLFYAAGLWYGFRRVWSVGRRWDDPFVTIAVATAALHLVLLVFTNVLYGVAGLALWSFLGVALAADHYYDPGNG